MQADIPKFVPFSPHRAIRIYRNNLPHWRQEGATYFITYRLADSMPADILEGWQREQRRWLAAREIAWDRDGRWQHEFEKLPAKERYEYRKTFNRKLQAHLDSGYGSCLLKNAELRTLAEDALEYFHRERFWLGDYVLMPNHVHALMTPLSSYELEEILASVKRYSSKRINEARGGAGKLWQYETYDHLVRSRGELKQFRQYIAENPAKAGLREGEFGYVTQEWMDAWVV